MYECTWGVRNFLTSWRSFWAAGLLSREPRKSEKMAKSATLSLNLSFIITARVAIFGMLVHIDLTYKAARQIFDIPTCGP